MKVGLNLLHAIPSIGGGWNYISRLVSALGGEKDKNIYVCFVNPKSAALVPSLPNFKQVLVNINAASRSQRILYENTVFPQLVKNYHLDLMHWFAATQAFVNTVPSVVTFYDLQVFDNPLMFPVIKRMYLQVMMKYAVQHAARLLPMSYTTALALSQNLGVDREQMSIIPAIVSSTFQPADNERVTEFRLKYRLPNKFWLYVAHFYTHKNHLRLLNAYHELKMKGDNPWPLVLRGDDHGMLTSVQEVVRELSLQDDVLFVPRLDEGELPLLYSAATAMVYPSQYEGGAMPVLEAIACGCPVIASKNPLLEEYSTVVVNLFDPLEVSSIAQALFQFQQSKSNYVDIRQRGLKRILDHRPGYVAEQLRQAYLHVQMDVI